MEAKIKQILDQLTTKQINAFDKASKEEEEKQVNYYFGAGEAYMEAIEIIHNVFKIPKTIPEYMESLIVYEYVKSGLTFTQALRYALFQDGWPMQEIADKLGVKKGTVQTSIQQARIILSKR